MRHLLLICLALLLACGCQQKEAEEKEAQDVGVKVGQTAPDLAGTDTTGQSVKLSDYKGKVVLLDFWATWCGPCRQMIPHEKELVKRLDGQPFVLLGVSADHKLEDLNKFMQQKDISWPNVFDGDAGPLSTAWKIRGFPTIFIIDSKGVIRFKQEGYNDASAKKIDNAIDKLLTDARY